MTAPMSSHDLIALIRKSGLLDDEQLWPYLDPDNEENTAADAQSLADRLVSDRLLTDFQTRKLLRGKWRGFFLGGYRLLAPLGKGGMGQVFLARQQRPDRLVAMKVLSAEHAQKPAAVARFHREARALTSLDHPNIVRAYDVGRQDAWMFLVMEYVEGRSLEEVVKTDGPLSVARAVDVIRQAALGLHHAHKVGWVHRDVKPSNLLLDRRGAVKVLDLGLALLCDDETDRLTRANGAILGTADYLAPEQSLDSHEVDGRADVYSLGATFYFLLTGRPPFAGGDTLQKVLRHRQALPRPVRLTRPDVPPALEAVLERMLAKKPEHRHPTLGAVIRALAPWTGAAGQAAAKAKAPASRPGRKPAPAPRRGWLRWVLACGLALAAGVAVLALAVRR